MKNDKEYNRQKNIIDAMNDPMFIHYLNGALGLTVLGDLAEDFLGWQKKSLTTSSKKV